ncbi:MAG TPA: hypothetical protein VGG74_06735 [Kofleriaceae bacterium]
MLKLWVACALTVASASVWAQPAPATATVVQVAPSVVAATDHARGAVVAAGQRIKAIAAQRDRLKQHFADQTAAIERLKNERQSWRRDRELNASQSDAKDTSDQLTGLERQLADAGKALADARRAFASAIDAELAAGATGPRGGQLARERADLDAVLGAKPKKIVMPDDVKIDQLDPEDLEQQDQIIADTEKQLSNQISGLDQQASELQRVAELRTSHDRANDMMIRDDDQPHRDVHGTTASGTTQTIGAAAPANGAGGASGSTGAGTGGNDFNGNSDHGNSSFETEASFVLGEVIDPSTLDTLARASRSGDPAKRAAAARATRDAVAARLDQLKKKRAQIEQREKQLRGGR